MRTFKTEKGVQVSHVNVLNTGFLTSGEIYFPCHTDCPFVKSFDSSEPLFASSYIKWVSSNLPYRFTRELNEIFIN